VLRNFLKSYDCFISVEETYSSIYSALNSIKNSMPNMLKEPFNSLIGKMIADSGKNSCDVNLGVLKNEIIPFIGRYISRMNDFGPVRDYVSVLVHNIVRLESSSRENFSTDLENLFDFIKFNLNVGDDELGRIKESLIENYENTSSIKNESVDSFLKLIKTGMKNSENIVSKGMMEDITKSLLICEDVHIPMTHMFLPLCCNGMFMFSELWVNKDFVEEGSNKSGYTRKPAFKVFITFDIQNVGYFETILIMKGSKITLEIFVPSSLKSCEKSIRNGIGDILGKNSISFSEIHISECSRKRKFSEIFSNIKERESGIDVII
jgi:hypothetical protein